MVEAFGIKREENQFQPEKNFTDIVQKEIEKSKPDTIILQGGSIEVSNIDVRTALMDTTKDFEDHCCLDNPLTNAYSWTELHVDSMSNLF